MTVEPTSKHHKVSKTIPTTTATGVKKKNKEREEFIKIVIRRLPAKLTKDELWEQLQSFVIEKELFWFCAADPEFRPHSYSRAYIAFREEQQAISFAERFNGYVFVDRHGSESMAIVECAPNQHVPKDIYKESNKSDIRTGTLQNEVQYLKFLDQYNADVVTGRKGVINFDELVHELEEKKHRLEEGQVQETPLTAYIIRSLFDKSHKKQQKQMERLERKFQKKPTIVERDDNIQQDITIANDFAKENANKERRKQKKKIGSNMQTPNEQCSKKNQTIKKEISMETSMHHSKIVADSRTEEIVRNKQKLKSKKLSCESEKNKKKLSTETEDIEQLKEICKNDKPDSNENNTDVTTTNQTKAKKQKSTDKKSSSADALKKNKDRPERELYRPRRARLQQQKPLESGNGGNIQTESLSHK